MQSEQIRGCREDPVEVQRQHHSESQLSQLRNSLIKEATALLPLLEAVIVFAIQTSVCRVLNCRTYS
jgi:hypothetical protein